MSPPRIRKLIIKRKAVVLSGDALEIATALNEHLQEGWSVTNTIIPWRGALVAILDTWVPEEEATA